MKRLIVLIIGGVLFSCQSSTNKIGYVENFELYDEFKLTQELQADLELFASAKQGELDSLKFSFDQLTAKLQLMTEVPNDDYQGYLQLQNIINIRTKLYEDEVLQMSQQYETQIWERLNGYIAEFAEQNEYDFILGATGSGSLMYAKDTSNLTTDLIEFCNLKYSGK